MSFHWERPPTQAWVEMTDAYADAIHRAVRTLADRYAPEIEAYMKVNAPWTDRTANARQTLYSEVQDVVRQYVDIVLAHGVEYGVYLELSNAGTYAIIGPSLDYFAPRIFQDVVSLMGG